MSDKNDAGKTIDKKELYEKAIEGRHHHQKNFNHWMNMYSIFNGALFVGYYSVKNDSPSILPLNIVILILGCAAGWSWHFSATGFYDWILSWIKVVQEHEKKLDIDDNNKFVVYRAYEGKPTISTQKITKSFSLLVGLAWSFLLVRRLVSLMPAEKFCEKVFFWCLFTILVSIIVSCFRRYVKESPFKPEPIS